MYLFQLTICYCGFRLKSGFKLFYLNPTHSSDGCTYANNWIESVLKRLIKCPQRTLKNKTDPENQSKNINLTVTDTANGSKCSQTNAQQI